MSYKYIGLLLFLLIVVSSLPSLAQGEDDYMLAKLHDGSVFYGSKVDEDDDMIRLRISTRDTIHVDRRLAKHIYDSDNAIVFTDGKYFETKGFFWTFSMGTNILTEQVSSHIEFLFAQRITSKFAVGGGTGFEFNEASAAGFNFDTQFSTLFAYGRFNILEGKRRFFAWGRIGQGFSSEDNIEGIRNEQEGGINAMLGVGLHFSSRSKSKFQLMLGQYFQETSGREFFIDTLGNEIETSYELLIKRLILKFGWEFG